VAKRTKHVFKSHEIPHLWAHQTQADARNPHNNLYFIGDTIYSYGRHFPIARIVKQGKKTCVLLTTRTYSSTTAGHISAVRDAIPRNMTVFNVMQSRLILRTAVSQTTRLQSRPLHNPHAIERWRPRATKTCNPLKH
jgi:hypothetical protein